MARSLELANVRSFKQRIVEIAGTVETINCKGNSVRIISQTDTRKQKLMELSQTDGKPVTVSLPWSVKKYEGAHDGQRTKQSQKQWAKGVVTRVPLELSIEEIKEETGAIWAHRITKRGSEGFVPTMAVIIAYENKLPNSVTLRSGDTVSVYIPNPVRCGKCQRYGHTIVGQCLAAIDVHSPMSTVLVLLHPSKINV